MGYKVGQHVRCIPKPEWGLGIVLSNISEDGKFYVDFEHAGRKHLTAGAKLEVVPERPAGCKFQHRAYINQALLSLQERANSALQTNRASGRQAVDDDANWADDIIRDVQRVQCTECGAWLGGLRKKTEDRLRAWCHSSDAPYEAGKPIAEEFSKLLYGYVVPERKSS